ncbi:hypothetical protein L198_05237 [Cryptococcus wingfieldii CBS 7118]|uniref:Zn(2)-C6 fungal-type domain-containing protein n=1 Tax=Cryptococcus wingfieldii CBS 7118 TaxID=1295528 RepID=A0A1E3J0N0_9TREE|nr:hypothetical protein L198_05237 [Cryptococcus wingfieldii CBS 7118]ODN94378.1 hypothetical protein L198_05237 [Cryptococcus wingfieldii CBS 7118]
MSDNSGFVRLNPVSQALADRLFLARVFTGFPSPSPITYTTTTNTTSGANNALGLQLFGNSGVSPASSTPSTITYTLITNDGNALLGHPLSAPTPSPTGSGDKRKPKRKFKRKARSSAHASNTRGIKASGAEKKRHPENYIRMPASCEHCRQQRKKCQRNRLEACIQCTDDDCECIFAVKAKQGATKTSRELIALERMFYERVIAEMPSTPSLASSSRASSMSPITPITPTRSTVELGSGPSSASVSAGLTSGFATPHIFMPFVPPTQLLVAVGANGILKDHRVVEAQQKLFDNKSDSWCWAVAAAHASESVLYHPPASGTTPVKPTYVRPADVFPVKAPHFSLHNESMPSALPSMGVCQPELPALMGQGLSESERRQVDELVMEFMDFGDDIVAAPPEVPCGNALAALLPTTETTPVNPTVEMSAISDSADPASIHFSYADFLGPQPATWFDAPQTQVEDENFGWGMCGMGEMEMSDDSALGPIESPFNTTPFGESFTPLV